MNILLVTEQREGKWNKTCFETLAAAQQISNETKSRLAAAVIGKGVAGLAGELAATKLDEVLLVEHDLLAAYTPDGYTLALQQAIAQAKPDLVLLPHTYQVRDFAPKLAASLGKGMIGDCVSYRHENGKLTFVRQMFQGKTVADVVFEGASPWFATFQAGAFRADLVAQGASKAPVTPVPVELIAAQIRTKPLEIFAESRRLKIFPWRRSWRACSAGNWRHRVRSAMKAGCRWTVKSGARGKRSPPSCTSRSESAEPSSTSWE